MLYLISYDLQLLKNYDALWAELNRLGGRRVLLSQWLVRSPMNAKDFRDHLGVLMDADDKLLVIEFPSVDFGNWAGFNLLVRVADM